MANAARAFQWLNTLEKDLDNNLVDIDLLLNNIDDGEDDLVESLRSKMSSLASIFAQIVHKSQTIFENNAKLEAHNLNLRRDFETLETEKKVQQEENSTLIQQIHCMQLRLYNVDDNSVDSDAILERLNKEMESRMEQARPFAQLESTVSVLESENADLKQYVLALQTELYGARLAAKYLDKELAGRIQQIQLLGHKIQGPGYQQLWSTLESEINLQRHKTVIRACKGPEGIARTTKEPASELINVIRNVTIFKKAKENLGMSVTGGKEHGVPLLISEIYANQLVANSGQLYVGDAILSVNGVSLRTMRHLDAVNMLCQPMEEISLEVMYVANHDGEDVEEANSVFVTDNGYRYRLYHHPGMATKGTASHSLARVKQQSQQQSYPSNNNNNNNNNNHNNIINNSTK